MSEENKCRHIEAGDDNEGQPPRPVVFHPELYLMEAEVKRLAKDNDRLNAENLRRMEKIATLEKQTAAMRHVLNIVAEAKWSCLHTCITQLKYAIAEIEKEVS